MNVNRILNKLLKDNIIILFHFFVFLLSHILLDLLIDSYISSFLVILILYFIYLLILKKDLSNFLIVTLLFIFFTFSVPVMNDRSLSIFVLKKIEVNKTINAKNLSTIYNEYKIDEQKFLLKRMDEQMNAGNLILKENYELTLRGHVFIAIFKFFDWVY